MPTNRETDFVVRLATVNCSMQETPGKLTTIDRGITIGHGMPIMHKDTKPDNFEPKFGKCKVDDKPCVPNCIEEWIFPAKEVMWQMKSCGLAMYYNKLALARSKVAVFQRNLVKELDKRNVVTKFWDGIFNKDVNSDAVKDSYVPLGKKYDLPDGRNITFENMQDSKDDVQSLQNALDSTVANAGKYMDKADGYEAAVAALKEAEVYSSALTTEQAGEQDHLLPVDKQEDLNELNENQIEKLHPIMMKSVLVCKKGGGAIITIVDTGQDEAQLEEQMIKILQAMYPDEEITVDNYADKLAEENMLARMRIYAEQNDMPLSLTQEQINESQEAYDAYNEMSTNDTNDSITPNLGAVTEGYPNYSSGSYHGGIDIPAAAETPVLAAQGGVVSKVYTSAQYDAVWDNLGIRVVIRFTGSDGNDHYAHYCHLHAESVLPSVGQQIEAGDTIGLVGSTGNSSGNHLHYEIRNSNSGYGAGVNEDPADYLD